MFCCSIDVLRRGGATNALHNISKCIIHFAKKLRLLGSECCKLLPSVSIQDHDHRVAETAVVGCPHDTFGEGMYV